MITAVKKINFIMSGGDSCFGEKVKERQGGREATTPSPDLGFLSFV